ncbi:hypothetical protein BO82DRAFT_403344 [Aspergillus uvarum CBS 121591]|uniref:Berberine/berberine-like domain-containing protein n=1 Tax=Aspergillus uvarum CBS 121591 TaxID=1448315 RepID=A0A319C8T8_9EURO|nr:hypothetical protein BO82DRAFT_403344 [Aspergillus uvarum CBS 121591]PYH80560.1 hypothetical protein BO82DRAFT_403344 [Aspergillus uvarum CBS 121591]
MNESSCPLLEAQSKPALWNHMRVRYQRAFPVAVGQYITEIDMNNETASTRVLSDTALAKFLKIREKYDPQGLFPNYRAIVRTHAKMDKLDSRAKL